MIEKCESILSVVYVSECMYEHQEYFDCMPCRQTNCLQPFPKFCPSTVHLCWGAGCYCKPGYLWDPAFNECVKKIECANHTGEYVDLELIDVDANGHRLPTED